MRYKTLIFTGLALLIISLALAACGQQTPTLPAPALDDSTPCPTTAPCPECPTCPTPGETGAAVEVPFLETWQNSGHAAAEDEAFVHWDEEGAVPADCAKCHSTPGYHDFLGVDGSAFGVVDADAPTGTVITCVACHNQVASTLQTVVFPSGVELTGLEESTRCAQCHQGRASKETVDNSIEEAGLTGEEDTTSADLRFINIHYYAAAATLFGDEANGGYEYEDQQYEGRFQHVEGYDTCASCHSPHALEIRVDDCAACHAGVASTEDLVDIRMPGSLVDYDGDGDVDEGIAMEIQTLQEHALTALQAYATQVAEAPIAYDPLAYPYWFDDANANGAVDEGEEGYASWTPRSLKAAYNYHTSIKDPGAYAHNAKYIIQLLHDSIADLGTAADTGVELVEGSRSDAGHFDSTAEAFRHWDEDGMVPADCVKCHTAVGVPMFLENAALSRDQVTGATIAAHPSESLNCTTCHSDLTTFSFYAVSQVKFPSGAVIGFGEDISSNVCLLCHQGRESNASLQAAIQDVETEDTVSESLNFRNPHYFAAGATLFGGEAQGAFQYEGKEYAGRFMHVDNFQTCAQCHDVHALEVNVLACGACHPTVTSEETLTTIRLNTPEDFDGDGNTEEGVAEEISSMHEALYAAIQAYAEQTEGMDPILFNEARYPYWFADPNANNEVDEGEGGYATWTPRLLGAAYNYTWVAKDPGAFAHNNPYIIQILYDSLESLNALQPGMTRPEVTGPVE